MVLQTFLIVLAKWLVLQISLIVFTMMFVLQISLIVLARGCHVSPSVAAPKVVLLRPLAKLTV